MENKNKTKIWVFILLASLAFFGGLAVFINNQTAIFKGLGGGGVSVSPETTLQRKLESNDTSPASNLISSQNLNIPQSAGLQQNVSSPQSATNQTYSAPNTSSFSGSQIAPSGLISPLTDFQTSSGQQDVTFPPNTPDEPFSVPSGQQIPSGSFQLPTINTSPSGSGASAPTPSGSGLQIPQPSQNFPAPSSDLPVGPAGSPPTVTFETPETITPELTVNLAPDTPGAVTKPLNTDWFTAAKLQFTARGRLEIKKIAVSAKNIAENSLSVSKIDKVQLFTIGSAAEPNQLTAAQSFDENGNAVFDLSGSRWIIEDQTQKLIIKAKLKEDALRGKKFALGIKQTLDIELESGQTANQNFPVMGYEITIQETRPASLACENGKIEENGQCACAAGTQEFTGGARGTFYSPNACVPCTVSQIIEAGGFYCPQDKPAAVRQAADNRRPAEEAASTSSNEEQPEQTRRIRPSPRLTEIPASPLEDVSQLIPETRGSAYEPTLQGTRRLVRAPEKAETGPEAIIYLGVLAAIQGGILLKRKFWK